MKNRRNSQRGVTLIELIITLALITITIAVVTNIFMVARQTFNTGVDKSSAQQNARFVSNKITDELKFAKNIDSVAFTSGEFYRMYVNNHSLLIQKYSGPTTTVGSPVTVGQYIESLSFAGSQYGKTINFTLNSKSNFTGNTAEAKVFLVNSSVQLMNNVGANKVIQNAITGSELFFTLY
ncbi:MAG: prepilin-type N-terminal cleavage/methylation domain-containing protein [Eubacteriaceae bacterium]|nr:prepilin-type N-terminal cleavage/methylation domain-containing protein [Eubacteriaceae bacterium]